METMVAQYKQVVDSITKTRDEKQQDLERICALLHDANCSKKELTLKCEKQMKSMAYLVRQLYPKENQPI